MAFFINKFVELGYNNTNTRRGLYGSNGKKKN